MHEFDKCTIFLKEGAKCAEGFVHEYESDVMKIYIQGEKSEKLIEGDQVYLYIYNSVKGECKFTGLVKKISFNNIEVTGISLISSVQKRDNTRVNKQMHYKIACRLANGEKKKLDKPADITVLNISAQGMYFNCERKFERGFTFPLVLRETSRPIHLEVEIIRCEEYPRSFNYGCIFVNISEKDMDEIFRFVLREQIAQRRRSNFI